MSTTTRFRRLGLLLSAILLGSAFMPQAGWARRSKLNPAKIKQIRETNKSFKKCRKQALGKLKNGKIGRRRFKLALNTCKEKFPGAGLYIQCKRRAVRASQKKDIPLQKALQRCKRFHVAASFDATEAIPVFVHKGQFYFAGIGLNKPIPKRRLDPPNFTCKRLFDVARNPQDAQYILFGNHPRTFQGVRRLQGKQLLRRLDIQKPGRRTDVPGFGRVFGDPRKGAAAVFFPSAPCDFDGVLGSMFSGLSAYYLIDSSGSSLTPYFGIAYYNEDQTEVTTSQLVERLSRQLGSDFEPVRKDRRVTFIAANPLGERDRENDPKNLCRRPRKHDFVGVVQGRREAPEQPEYIIVANIGNLCSFGDRLGRRLAR